MANVGYVTIAHFAVAVERRQRPELRGRPVVIGGYPHERKMVYAASAEAIAAGVKPGLTLRQAEQLCPDAVFLPVEEARYEEAGEGLLAIVESFSPAVAPDGPGSAYFDARGWDLTPCPLSYRGGEGVTKERGWTAVSAMFPKGAVKRGGGDEDLAWCLATAVQRRLGMVPCVGLGPSRFTAWVAARSSEPGAPGIVAGAPAELLADLPVEYLSGDAASRLPGGEAEFRDRLRLLGIRTIGQFMRLPFAELMEQFGPAGVAACHLARGDRDPPLLPRARPAALERRQWFEPPIGEATALAGASGRLSAALAVALQRRYQACQTVILRLELTAEGGSVGGQLEQTAQLREPTAQAGAIAAAALRLHERMRRELGMPGERDPENTSAELQITAVRLVVTGLVAEGGSQLGLFDGQRRRAHLRRAVAEVHRRFGDRLKRAEPVPVRGVAGAPFALRDYLG